MSKFQLAILAIFSICIFIGVALFALSKNKASEGKSNLVIWGTMSRETFDAIASASDLQGSGDITVNYVKKDVARFDSDFIEALAEGTGPDIVILREDQIHKHRNKIFIIPYKSYTERMFKDTFIEGGEFERTRTCWRKNGSNVDILNGCNNFISLFLGFFALFAESLGFVNLINS